MPFIIFLRVNVTRVMHFDVFLMNLQLKIKWASFLKQLVRALSVALQFINTRHGLSKKLDAELWLTRELDYSSSNNLLGVMHVHYRSEWNFSQKKSISISSLFEIPSYTCSMFKFCSLSECFKNRSLILKKIPIWSSYLLYLIKPLFLVYCFKFF